MFRGLLYLWRFCWQNNKRYLLCGITLQFVRTLAPLAGVVFPKLIIDELTGAQDPGRLLLLTGSFLLLLLVAGCLSSYLTLTGFAARIQVHNAFTAFMHDKLARADYAQIQDPGFLDIKARAEKFLTADWHGSFYLLDEALSVIGHLFTLAGVAAIVITLDPLVALALLGLIALQTVVDTWAKKGEIDLSLRSAASERQGMYYTSLFEEARYAKEIRLNGMRDWLLAREQGILEKGARFYEERNAFYLRQSVLGALNTFAQQALTYAYVVYKICAGQIGIGDFFLYTSAVNTFSTATRALIKSAVWIQSYGKYYDALEAYVTIPETMRGGKAPAPQAPHTFVFEGVGYRYPGQTVWALRHINLVVNPGEKLSIVGENGAGKSTFVKLLMRLYDPTEGRITLNGIDIRTIDYDAYLTLFGAVFQDFELFAFPLAENITLADTGPATDAAVTDALRQAGLANRLATLPDGIRTMVSRRFEAPEDFPSVFKQQESTGFEPSGGEAQKIALARALYRNSPIVVLDEPTAALDPRAEYEMYQQFDTMVAGKTALYVSHRMSSARFCDRIAVFQNGEITELGPHDTLMARQGHYAVLYAMQSAYYK